MKNKKILIPIVVVAIAALLGFGLLNSNKKNNDNNSDFSDKNSKFTIKESETKTIKFTDFDNGLVKMRIPEGWKVDVLGDYIHYTIKAYDPQRPTYQFFFNLKTEGYNKSQEAKAFQQKYYPNSLFAKTSVIEGKNTEGFYKIFNDLGTLNNTSTFTYLLHYIFSTYSTAAVASSFSAILFASRIAISSRHSSMTWR